MAKKFTLIWASKGWNHEHDEPNSARILGEHATLAAALEHRKEVQSCRALAMRLWGAGYAVILGATGRPIIGAAALLLKHNERVERSDVVQEWAQIGDQIAGWPTDRDVEDFEVIEEEQTCEVDRAIDEAIRRSAS